MIEHSDPGGISCTTRKFSPETQSIDVGDGHHHELEFHVHDLTASHLAREKCGMTPPQDRRCAAGPLHIVRTTRNWASPLIMRA
jgi:hypothetical protein